MLKVKIIINNTPQGLEVSYQINDIKKDTIIKNNEQAVLSQKIRGNEVEIYISNEVKYNK